MSCLFGLLVSITTWDCVGMGWYPGIKDSMASFSVMVLKYDSDSVYSVLNDLFPIVILNLSFSFAFL